MIRDAGFVGTKFDAVWPTALKLRDSGMNNASILRRIFEDFSYLLQFIIFIYKISYKIYFNAVPARADELALAIFFIFFYKKFFISHPKNLPQMFSQKKNVS